MPCNCDHMEATQHEVESKTVASLLKHVLAHQSKEIPEAIRKAANNYYGDIKRVHEFTAQLCGLCGVMDNAEAEAIIYNGHDKNSRKLATWWEAHQNFDAIKLAAKKEIERNRLADKEAEKLEAERAERKSKSVSKKKMLKISALSKLSKEEREALGL